MERTAPSVFFSHTFPFHLWNCSTNWDQRWFCVKTPTQTFSSFKFFILVTKKKSQFKPPSLTCAWTLALGRLGTYLRAFPKMSTISQKYRQKHELKRWFKIIYSMYPSAQYHKNCLYTVRTSNGKEKLQNPVGKKAKPDQKVLTWMIE